MWDLITVFNDYEAVEDGLESLLLVKLDALVVIRGLFGCAQAKATTLLA